jgi:hypothetical protein
MNKGLAVVTGLWFATAPAVAFAQERCEGGEWFCDEPAPAQDGAAEDEPQFETEPTEIPPDGKGAAAERDRKIELDHVEPPRRPRHPFRRREWGLNLHLVGALMGNHDALESPPERHPEAGMGGAGIELRYRTVPHFAFVVGADFVGGTDLNGDARSESGLLLGGMVFFNPRNQFQLYMPMGIGFANAKVTMAGDGINQEHETRYSYFGAFIGLGGELRAGRRLAFNLELLGFGRTRTDVREGDAPEYVDPQTGLATNSSGGGLVRGGVTFYW